MSFLSLVNDAKWSKVANASGAATTEVDSSILDMSGYDSVVFLVSLATVTDASVLTLTAQQNTVNSTSGMTAITGGAATFTALGSSNTGLLSEVFRPVQGYVRAAFTRTTQNAAVDCIWAIQFNSRSLPVTQSATVLASNYVAAQ